MTRDDRQRPPAAARRTVRVPNRKISIRVVHANKNREVGRAQVEVEVLDRLLASDFLLQLPPVPFEEAGRYEFQLLMNGAYLGSAVVDAELRPTETVES